MQNNAICCGSLINVLENIENTLPSFQDITIFAMQWSRLK
jgi:hypothetical protein